MRSKLFPILVMILLLLLVGFACKQTVDVPTPTGVMVDGDRLVWDEVPGAIEYDICVDDDEIIVVYETNYLIELYDSATHTLTVSVVTADGKSKPSAPVSYTHANESSRPLTILAAPTLRISGTRLMWNNVLDNSGYRITFNGKTFETAKNVTYYDLTFPKDGEYIVRIQTIGDGITYYSSQKSELKVTVTGGKAKLLPLTAESIRYDADKKKIEWANKYSQDSVKYQIYKDGVLEAEMDADASLARMSYAPILNGAVTSYTLRLVSNDGLFDPSAYSDPITFPILEPAVEDLCLQSKNGAYAFVWKKCQYAREYVLTIDDVEYPASSESLPLPSGLAAGDHVVRVRAVGDNVYLAGSLSSREQVFTLGANGVPVQRLAVPTVKSAISNENGYRIVLMAVEGATGYHLRVAKGTRQMTVDVTSADIAFLRSSEDADVAALIALLDAGGKVSFSAYSAQVGYVDSAYSEEIVLSEESPIEAPRGLQFFAGGVRWTEMTSVEDYYLCVDGEVITVSGSTRYEPAFTTGVHTFKVAAAQEGALYSEEIIVSLPLRLEAPSSLKITSNVLSFVGDVNAASYRLYVNGVAQEKSVSVATSLADLSSYIETDGKYYLTLRSVRPSVYYADSLLSEELVYEKTDGKYGTVMKPYRIATAEDFVSLIAEDPSAYFTLTASEYDFASTDILPLYKIKFTGNILGNNAVLKNITLRTCLFSQIEDAEISDLTFSFKADRFAYDGNGILVRTMKSSVLRNVAVVLSGETTLVREASFGLMVYEATDVTFDAVRVVADGLRVLSVLKVTVGGVAYKLNGMVSDLTTQGTLELTVGEAVFGGVSREGEHTLTDADLALGINGTATMVNISGVTVAGNVAVTGGRIAGVSTIRNADIVLYYGVTKTNVSVLSAEVGGTLSMEGVRNADVFGITEGLSGSIRDVVSTLALTCEATERVSAAGIAENIGSDLTKGGLSFAGAFDLTAPNVIGAAVAIDADAAVSAEVSGSLRASGGTTLITGGVVNAASVDVTFTQGATLAVYNANMGTIVGAAMDATGTVAARGVLSLSASDTDILSVSGVYGGQEGRVEVAGLTISGALRATELSLGGVTESASVITGRITDLTVDVSIISNNFSAAGAFSYVESLDLTEKATVTATIDATGTGKLCGFAVEMLGTTLDNVLVQGAMSLTGEGDLCGVVYRTDLVTNVECRADLTASGDVCLSGIAGEIREGSKVTLSKATLRITAENARIYGIAASAESLSGKVSEVTFTASPKTRGVGSSQVCGFTDSVGSSSGIIVEKTTFTIGEFAEGSFAAVAKTASGIIRSASVSYTVSSAATASDIGGVFGSVSGTMEGFTIGTQDAPVQMYLSGSNVSAGGIAVDTATLTVRKSATNVLTTINLASAGMAKIGGAFARVSDSVEMEDTTLGFTLEDRQGTGALSVGGAVAYLTGSLVGAQTKVSFISTVYGDLFGGVVAEMKGGTLSASSATGRILVARSGGIVCETGVGAGAKRATLSRCAATLTQNNGGGLVYRAVKTDIDNCYALSTVPAGLVWSGTNLTVDHCYFGGVAEYSVAYELSDHTVDNVIVDASMRHLPCTSTGAVTPAYMTLAYGYDVTAVSAYLDREVWTIEETAYPYLTAVGSLGTAPSAQISTLDKVMITDGMDLYATIAYRSYGCETPAVVWVDQTGILEVKDGIVTLHNNGEGELIGYLSGGKIVYTLPYSVDVFEPFEGTGSEADPYVITDVANIKHMPSFATKYYVKEGKIAHFRLTAGRYEDAALPALTASYATYIDCTDVILVSPTIAAGGIFGSLTGGSVTGLTIVDPSVEDVLLFADATGVALSGVTVHSTVSGTFEVIGSMTGGNVTDVSCSVEATSADYAVHLVGNTENVTFTRVQFYFEADASLTTSACSLVGEDSGSSFIKCAVYIAADTDNAYPFAFTASGTSYTDCSAVVYGLAAGEDTCSDVRTASLSGLTIRYCDCDVYTYDGESISVHKDVAAISDEVTDAADELAAAFTAFISEYTLTDSPAQHKVLSPSAAYDLYAAFYAKVTAFFALAEGVDGASCTLTSGVIVGADKPYSIVFGEEDATEALRTLVARSFGYSEAAFFAEKALSVAALLDRTAVDADSIGGRLVYDGAIYTANDTFILPYVFKCGTYTTLVCVFVVPDGSTAVWIGDVASAKKTANTDADSLMSQLSVTTEVYGRCSLFDITRVAPVKRASGVTYTNVLFAVNGEPETIAGVTFTSFGEANTLLKAEPYAFIGALPAPVGYDRFGREEAYTFSLTDDEGEVTTLVLDGVDEWDLYRNWNVESDAAFGAAVSFTLTAELGQVTSDGILHVSGNGTGTLTVTNVYGVSKVITVTVTGHYGFAYGSGTEEDPYEIHTLSDMQAVEYYEDAHFILKENVVGTLTAPLVMNNGTLHGNGKTVRLTLDGAAQVFSSCTGKIESVRFEIIGAETTGALFLSESDLLVLTDVTFALSDVTMNVAAGETVGLLFDRIEGSVEAWSGITLDLSDITIEAAEGGIVGLLTGSASGVEIAQTELTATITLAAGDTVTFGGLVGVYNDAYSSDILLSDITANLTLTGSLSSATDTLILGGVAGVSSVMTDGVTAKVAITVNASGDFYGNVTVGGVMGESSARLSDITVSGSIRAYGKNVFAGGVAGYAAAELSNVHANVTVYAESAVRAYAGGVAGRMDASITRGTATGTVSVLSHATDEDLSALVNTDDVILAVASAGGAVGYMEGQLRQFTVSSVTVTSTATGVTHGYVLAGGVAGYVSDVYDCVVKGAELTATGVDGATGGVAGVLKREMEYVIVSDVILDAAKKAGAVGVFSLVQDAFINGVICTADVGAAIADHIELIAGSSDERTGVVSNSRYLYGQPIGDTVDPAYNVNNVQAASIDDLYGTEAYNNEYVTFDEDIWAFAPDGLPVLKSE